jgi:hypothetical protein
MVKIHNVGKRSWILSFDLYKIIRLTYSFSTQFKINEL